MVARKIDETRRAPRQSRSRATVEAILTAAADVAHQEGYDRATTDRIAARAGVSVGSLYQYFSNKNDIYTQLINRERIKMITALQATRNAGADDPAKLLSRYIEIGAGQNNLLFKFHRELQRSPDLSHLLNDLLSEVTNEVATLIAMFRADLDAERVADMAQLIVACAEGLGREPIQAIQGKLGVEFQTMVIRYVVGEPA